MDVDEGGTGMGLRDHDGKLLRAQALWYGDVSNSMMMEAYAIRDGVRLAGDIGLTDIIVESDAQQLVKLWDSMAFDRSEVAPILNEVLVLSESFRFFKLVFVAREANELAHLCAKQASSNRRRCLWINFVPPFLDACIKRDCNPG